MSENTALSLGNPFSCYGTLSFSLYRINEGNPPTNPLYKQCGRLVSVLALEPETQVSQYSSLFPQQGFQGKVESLAVRSKRPCVSSGTDKNEGALLKSICYLFSLRFCLIRH